MRARITSSALHSQARARVDTQYNCAKIMRGICCTICLGLVRLSYIMREIFDKIGVLIVSET